MSQEYKCISPKTAEIWEVQQQFLGDPQLYWRAAQPVWTKCNKPAPFKLASSADQVKLMCIYNICLYVCQTWTTFWLAFGELANKFHHFLFFFGVCYYPDSLSSKCSIFIWHICTWSISMCVCLGIYFCSILPSLGRLLLRVSPSKMKSRKKSNEVKMLHSKFIIVVVGPHSGKYLSMCLSPIEIIRT